MTRRKSRAPASEKAFGGPRRESVRKRTSQKLFCAAASWYRGRKNRLPVTIDEELKANGESFKLQAVIMHGGVAQEGHWFLYRRRIDEDNALSWYSYNDSVVSVQNYLPLMSARDARVLLYRRSVSVTPPALIARSLSDSNSCSAQQQNLPCKEEEDLSQGETFALEAESTPAAPYYECRLCNRVWIRSEDVPSGGVCCREEVQEMSQQPPAERTAEVDLEAENDPSGGICRGEDTHERSQQLAAERTAGDDRLHAPPTVVAHTLKIMVKYERMIQSGAKTVEGRLNSGVAARIQAGDIVMLGSTRVIVEQVWTHVTFADMLQFHGVAACLPDMARLNRSHLEAASVYHRIRGYELGAQRHGVRSFKIHLESQAAETVAAAMMIPPKHGSSPMGAGTAEQPVRLPVAAGQCESGAQSYGVQSFETHLESQAAIAVEAEMMIPPKQGPLSIDAGTAEQPVQPPVAARKRSASEESVDRRLAWEEQHRSPTSDELENMLDEFLVNDESPERQKAGAQHAQATTHSMHLSATSSFQGAQLAAVGRAIVGGDPTANKLPFRPVELSRDSAHVAATDHLQVFGPSESLGDMPPENVDLNDLSAWQQRQQTRARSKATSEAGCLDEQGDAHRFFMQHVRGLLTAYRAGSPRDPRTQIPIKVLDYLRALPLIPPSVSHLNFSTAALQLRQMLQISLCDRLTSTTAGQGEVRLFDSQLYALAVLFTAAGISTRQPPVLLNDFFMAACCSLHHKDLHVQTKSYVTRARLWCSAVGVASSGKSPSMDPVIDSLMRACDRHRPLAVGGDGLYHRMTDGCTHKGSVLQLAQNDGYLLITCDEAHKILPENWAASKGAKWDQTLGPDFPASFMNAAHGGRVEWLTADDVRKGRKPLNPKAKTRAPPPVTEMPSTTTPPYVRVVPTNMVVMLAHHGSLFRNFWAQGAGKRDIGMGTRTLFVFGSKPPPRTPGDDGFIRAVLAPFMDNIFEQYLMFVGPKSPTPESPADNPWKFEAGHAEFMAVWEAIAKRWSLQVPHCEYLNGAVDRIGYQSAGVALEVSLLHQFAQRFLWGGNRSFRPAPAISMQHLFIALQHFILRWIHGHMIMQVEIFRKAWTSDDAEEALAAKDTAVITASRCWRILRAIPYYRITVADVAEHFSEEFGQAINNDSTSMAETQDAIVELLEEMVSLGLGIVLSDRSFHKFSWDQLPGHTRQMLLDNNVSPRSFGAMASEFRFLRLDSVLKPNDKKDDPLKLRRTYLAIAPGQASEPIEAPRVEAPKQMSQAFKGETPKPRALAPAQEYQEQEGCSEAPFGRRPLVLCHGSPKPERYMQMNPAEIIQPGVIAPVLQLSTRLGIPQADGEGAPMKRRRTHRASETEPPPVHSATPAEPRDDEMDLLRADLNSGSEPAMFQGVTRSSGGRQMTQSTSTRTVGDGVRIQETKMMPRRIIAEEMHKWLTDIMFSRNALKCAALARHPKIVEKDNDNFLISSISKNCRCSVDCRRMWTMTATAPRARAGDLTYTLSTRPPPCCREISSAAVDAARFVTTEAIAPRVPDAAAASLLHSPSAEPATAAISSADAKHGLQVDTLLGLRIHERSTVQLKHAMQKFLMAATRTSTVVTSEKKATRYLNMTARCQCQTHCNYVFRIRFAADRSAFLIDTRCDGLIVAHSAAEHDRLVALMLTAARQRVTTLRASSMISHDPLISLDGPAALPVADAAQHSSSEAQQRTPAPATPALQSWAVPGSGGDHSARAACSSSKAQQRSSPSAVSALRHVPLLGPGATPTADGASPAPAAAAAPETLGTSLPLAGTRVAQQENKSHFAPQAGGGKRSCKRRRDGSRADVQHVQPLPPSEPRRAKASEELKFPHWMSDAQISILTPLMEAVRGGRLTAQTIRRMWRRADCDIKNAEADKRSLQNWIYYMKQRGTQKPGGRETRQPTPTTISEFIAQMKLLIKDPCREHPFELVVLPEIADDPDGIMIPMTCWAFLNAPRHNEDEVVCEVVDGKQKQLPHNWTYVTVGWLTRSKTRRRTTIARRVGNARHRKQSREFTCRMVPFVTAIAPSENKKSMNALFRVIEKYWPRSHSRSSHAARVRQFHRDYAAAFEYVRKLFYSESLAMGDFVHYTRNLASGVKASNLSIKAGEHVRALSYMTRTLPTIELFSMIWQHEFAHLHHCRLHRFTSWLTNTYFFELAARDLMQRGCVHLQPGTRQQVLFLAHWFVGMCFGITMTASGTQTIEAFHELWEAQAHEQSRSENPHGSLEVVRTVFRTVGEDLGLDKPDLRLTLRPVATDPRLLAIDGLKSVGEYSAMDLWRFRHFDRVENFQLIRSALYPGTEYVVFNASTKLRLTQAQQPEQQSGITMATPYTLRAESGTSTRRRKKWKQEDKRHRR